MESYRCIVCQEEITPEEQSYSIKFYKMALCRKHQEIQKIALARQVEEQKSDATYSCIVCKEPITAEENNYAMTFFNMALCRKHQKIQKQIQTKKDAEQKNIEGESKQACNQEVMIPSEKNEDVLIKWLVQWASERPVNLSIESKQFFIEGLRLDELARDLIEQAKDEILVTSPFVDSCHPITLLAEAKERRVDVRIVSSRPKKEKEDVKKVECHALLRKKGVNIHYINTIHAKIIIIDRKIAIVSSMNLYSGSTGGGLAEAGIVSFEPKVVQSATKYITDLLSKTESPDITSYSSKYYGRKY